MGRKLDIGKDNRVESSENRDPVLYSWLYPYLCSFGGVQGLSVLYCKFKGLEQRS